MTIESKEMQQAIFDAIIVHKFMIYDHRFFSLVAPFIKTSRSKKNEAINDTLG